MSARVPSMTVRQPVARIQSIARAKAILDVLSAGDGGWVALRDIAAGTGLAKTTAFSLSMALVEVGLIEHDPGRAPIASASS